jgi:phosphate transport system substrate-binding protein
MTSFKVTAIAALLTSALMPGGPVFAGTKALRVNGSTTVAPIVSALAESQLAGKQQVIVDTQGGSKGGLMALKLGDADVGMISSVFHDEDKELFKGTQVKVKEIALDALAIVVSKDVYDGGVKKLTISDLKGIYESKVTNWSELGGKPGQIQFYNKEPGRGTRESFLTFVYGKHTNAPQSIHPIVGSNQESVTRLNSGKNMMTILSFAWIQKSDNIRAVAIESKDKSGFILPSTESILSHKYPFTRPLNLVAKLPLSPEISNFFQVFESPASRKVIEEQGFVVSFAK